MSCWVIMVSRNTASCGLISCDSCRDGANSEARNLEINVSVMSDHCGWRRMLRRRAHMKNSIAEMRECAAVVTGSCAASSVEGCCG